MATSMATSPLAVVPSVCLTEVDLTPRDRPAAAPLRLPRDRPRRSSGRAVTGHGEGSRPGDLPGAHFDKPPS